MIDQHDYLPAFLADAREHLQDLGLAILRIEAAPDDHLASEGIFRVAHSLKGMSATMGFEAIVALTHAMEDVFELLRQRAGGLPPQAIDVLSACLDALEGAVESIAAGGGEQLNAAPLVERLRQLARERTPSQELARAGDVALPDLTRADGSLLPGEHLLHVVAELAEDCQMPGVRAFMVFEALRGHGELTGGVPAPDAVERFDGRRLEAWIATRADASTIEEAARAVGELATVRVQEAEALPSGSAPADATSAPAVRAGAATVRVDAERLDELLHLMGELVQHRTTVEALAADADVPGLTQAVQRLARTSQALQETVTRVRMVPVESVFLRFPRLVRDLATRLGKQVELRLEGADTELDRTVVDALGDPLVHLVRNALDHGLETPDERAAAGKPPVGVVELSARHAGGHVIVSVRDDGRGIDPAAVGRVAVERGLLGAEDAAALDATGAAELLFAPGFSTARETTDVSGRGVGMDAVRERVRALGGEVGIEAGAQGGTSAQLRLPLTLASITALLVTVDDLPYAIPLDRIVRTVRLDAVEVRTVRGAPLLPLGGELLAFCEVDGGPPQLAERPYAVVLTAAGRRVALAVSGLVGQRELVTRRLPSDVSPHAAATGGAVLPDGQIALVVDCDALSPGQPEGVQP
ncbi:MAG TPA: chemotaxis protein CheA [Conexibacter sp.]|nr:chemotaxis protein CheA [Conexibacter sp.]